MSRIILLLAIMQSLYSCSNKEGCNELDVRIKDVCTMPNVIYSVSLDSLVDFEWDELYIIGGPRFPEEVEEIIKLDYKKVIKDNYEQYIYVKGNKIVKEEASSCRDFTLSIFKESRLNGYTKYNKSSIISVRKEEIDGKLEFKKMPD